jgi:hypothetical protein
LCPKKDGVCGNQSKGLKFKRGLEYLKMITTPRVLLCRAWIEEQPVRKKVWLKASLEDGEGQALATGNALFILKKLPKL